MRYAQWVRLREQRKRKVKLMKAALDEAVFAIERLQIVNTELRAKLENANRHLKTQGYLMKDADILPLGRLPE